MAHGVDSATLLSRFGHSLSHGRQQTLKAEYFQLLEKLGNPHLHMPPVFHVAGTNGKGSTCAFLRAMLEAAGYKVHVYTSPHLVHFHERIRLAGKLISEPQLVELLLECESFDQREKLSDFEAVTAAAFAAFARYPADFLILETGLGGRLDCTNIVPQPLATLITRLSFDHRDFLGDTLTKIAREKAGIMRRNVPCFVSAQPDAESVQALQAAAVETGAPLFRGGKDWNVIPQADGFTFTDPMRRYDLPTPALLGEHQYANAGLAIAALSVLHTPLTEAQIIKGLQSVEWPARLQQLKTGSLAALLPATAELWLDGGHNDSAGEVLGAQAAKWATDQCAADQRPLHLIYGMLTTKQPQEFLQHLAPYAASIRTIAIPNEALSFTAEDLAVKAREAGMVRVKASLCAREAIMDIVRNNPNPRILICGSLYLAGEVLRENG